MIKLDIIGIDGYSCLLRNINDKEYNINIEFYDIDFKLEIGDILYMNEEVVNHHEILRYGDIESEYGRKIIDDRDKDIIVIIKKDKKYYLKRLYG